MLLERTSEIANRIATPVESGQIRPSRRIVSDGGSAPGKSPRTRLIVKILIVNSLDLNFA